MRMSPSKKATVESREVGLNATKYQKSTRENYRHSSMRLVTFTLCHSSGEYSFVSNMGSRTRCVWFNGSRAPIQEKERLRVRIFFQRLNGIWNPRKISDYTGQIYLAI